MITYDHIVEATFVARPNRFIAHCLIDNKEVIAHVKNTGKCKELLIPGTTVYLQYHDNPKRKTAYSLICVLKGTKLINMDSQIPNKVCIDALKSGALKLPGIDTPLTYIKGEHAYGNSRFDVYVESGETKAFIEVKGVTLEEDGIVRFPDAPTERGIKHINELIHATKEGYKSYILFVIQLEGIKYFEPNEKTHKAFGDVLRSAYHEGVTVLAYDTHVTSDSILLNKPIPIKLFPESFI